MPTGVARDGSLTARSDSAAPHRVDVWVDTATAPVANPTLAATVNTAPKIQAKFVAAAVTLGSSIQLKAGESLFVAVEMSNQTSGKAMCIVTCGAGTTGEKSYTSWTNALANNSPPYLWTSYSTMGSTQELSTQALGFEG